jgi:hypothetical protein
MTQPSRRRCRRRAQPKRWCVQRDGVQPRTSNPIAVETARRTSRSSSASIEGNGRNWLRPLAPTNCNKFFVPPAGIAEPRQTDAPPSKPARAALSVRLRRTSALSSSGYAAVALQNEKCSGGAVVLHGIAAASLFMSS